MDNPQDIRTAIDHCRFQAGQLQKVIVQKIQQGELANTQFAQRKALMTQIKQLEQDLAAAEN